MEIKSAVLFCQIRSLPTVRWAQVSLLLPRRSCSSSEISHKQKPLLQRLQTLSTSDCSITGKWCLFPFSVSLGCSIHHPLPESQQRLLQKKPTTFWWQPHSSEVSSKSPTGFIRATNCSFVLSACFYSQNQLPECWSWSRFHSWIIRIYCDLN